jgi:signal transduction histidine kinase
MFHKISIKLVILFLLVALCPLFFFGDKATKTAKQAVIESSGAKFTELARNTIQTLDQMLYARKADIESWAKDEVLQDLAIEDRNGRVKETLSNWKRQYGIYSAIYAIDNSGKILASSEKEAISKSVVNELWYRSASRPSGYTRSILSNRTLVTPASIGDLEYDSLSGSYGVNFSVPIYSLIDNKQIGLLVSRLNWSELFEVISAVMVTPGGQSKTSYTLLLNNKGDVISGPGFILSEGQNNDEAIFHRNLLKENFQSAQKALTKERGFLIEKNDSTQYLIGYAGSTGYLDFDGLGWAVLVIQDSREAFATVNALEEILKLTGGVTLALALFFAFLFGRSLSGRLKEIENFAASLSKGYLGERLAKLGGDEVGKLSTTLNEMAEALNHQVEEAKIAKQNAELANRKKGEFLLDISHQIRGPISSVIETSELMLGTSLSGEQKISAQAIRKGACAALALTNEIRDISKLETGKDSTGQSSFELNALTEEVADVLGLTAAHMGVEVSVHYPKDIPKRFIGDQVRLHQIITNLTSYALKYTEKGKVVVSVNAGDKTNGQFEALITADDSNLGLDREKLRQLLSRIAHEKSADHVDEIAEDLTTSKRMVELMGGQLGQVHDQNLGSVVWITLPLSVDE